MTKILWYVESGGMGRFTWEAHPIAGEQYAVAVKIVDELGGETVFRLVPDALVGNTDA